VAFVSLNETILFLNADRLPELVHRLGTLMAAGRHAKSRTTHSLPFSPENTVEEFDY
jgi:hypothetical protein